MSEGAPYPFHRWPQVSARQAALSRVCARRLPLASAERAAAALGELLGARAEVTPGLPAVLEPAAQGLARPDPIVAAVALAPDGETRMALELDPRLALCIVDRALGGEAGREIGVPLVPLREPDRGVLGYVLGRALAEASEPPWRLGAVVTTEAALRAALGDGPVASWPATLRVGDDRGSGRLWIPERALGAVAPVEPAPALGRALARLSLDLVVEAGSAALPPSELRSLRPSDVVVLDEASVQRTAQGWTGRARAHVAGARRTSWWCVIEDEGLRLQSVDEAAESPAAEGRRMAEQDGLEDTSRMLEQVGDAPVEISVELARFTLPLEELGALRPGEVVATGRAVGERVTLRAGERAVAWGELVDVDGEVGVRVLRLPG